MELLGLAVELGRHGTAVEEQEQEKLLARMESSCRLSIQRVTCAPVPSPDPDPDPGPSPGAGPGPGPASPTRR